MQIGGHKYTIAHTKYMQGSGEMGRTYYNIKRVLLASHSNRTRKAFPAEALNETFWHELTHAILYEMGSPLHTDEKFVTSFSYYLSRAVDTARF
jgi:predicted SprT family Zn-dependent metalloprotease